MTVRSPYNSGACSTEFGPLFLLIVIVLAVAALHPSFLSTANLLTIGLQGSVNALLAIGMTLVIISGGVDLSVGTAMSLSMVVMAIATMTIGLPMSLGMLVALGMGLVIGAVNGFLIAFGRIPPFIVTLGMLGIAQGTALKLSGGYSMYGFPDWFDFIGNGEILRFLSLYGSSPRRRFLPSMCSRSDRSAAMRSRSAPARRARDAPASTSAG